MIHLYYFFKQNAFSQIFVTNFKIVLHFYFLFRFLYVVCSNIVNKFKLGIMFYSLEGVQLLVKIVDDISFQGKQLQRNLLRKI